MQVFFQMCVHNILADCILAQLNLWYNFPILGAECFSNILDIDFLWTHMHKEENLLQLVNSHFISM